jgi:hypothetical protein
VASAALTLVDSLPVAVIGTYWLVERIFLG